MVSGSVEIIPLRACRMHSSKCFIDMGLVQLVINTEGIVLLVLGCIMQSVSPTDLLKYLNLSQGCWRLVRRPVAY